MRDLHKQKKPPRCVSIERGPLCRPSTAKIVSLQCGRSGPLSYAWGRRPVLGIDENCGEKEAPGPEGVDQGLGGERVSNRSAGPAIREPRNFSRSNFCSDSRYTCAR